jgi:hypothetical protein
MVQQTFICPNDPTAQRWDSLCANGWAGASYGANFLVFGNSNIEEFTDPDGLGGSGIKGKWAERVVIPGSFPDGSTTILFAEKYMVCGDGTKEGAFSTGTAWAWANHSSAFAPAVAMESPWNDGKRFQVLPKPEECKAQYAQTGHSKGMTVAIVDGTVHTLDQSISPLVYEYIMRPNDGHTFSQEMP